MHFLSKKEYKKGFTLIEALVAVSIVLVGVTTVFAVAQMGIASASSVRNRITAMFLAQEAMEAVKNLKDSNLHKISNGQSINWLEGLTIVGFAQGPCPSTINSANSSCAFDVREDAAGWDTFYSCKSYDCKMYTENNNTYSAGFYRQSRFGRIGQDVDSGFDRHIYITEIVPGKQARVRVVIAKPGTTFPTFQVVGYIYNWF